MSKLTGKDIQEALTESLTEVELDTNQPVLIDISMRYDDTSEPASEVYKRMAKKLNDTLVYGHKPSKD